MVMSWIFTGILMVSFFFAAMLGRGSELAAAIPTGAQAGITLAISMAGSICLWTGVGKLMEKTGLTGKLATRHDPILAQNLSGNICANFLGLGNAATPMGIQAAKRLVDPADPTRAGDEICRLIVLNTASIQLIPANVAAVRASLGCAAPFDILPAVWITSICSAGLGVFAAWLMGKVWRHE